MAATMIQSSSNINNTNTNNQQDEMKLDRADENEAISVANRSSASSFDLGTMVDLNGLYTGGINQVEPHRALDNNSQGNQPSTPQSQASHQHHHHHNHHNGRRGTPPPNSSSPRHSQAQIKRSSTVLNEELKEDVEEEAREEAEHRKMSNPGVINFDDANTEIKVAKNADNTTSSNNNNNRPVAATTSRAGPITNQILPNGGPPQPVGNNANSTTNTAAANNDLFVASTHTKNYTIEYSFKKIKAAYLIDSKDFLEYLKLFFLFFLNLLVFFPLILFISAIFMPYKYVLRLFYKLFHMCHLTRTSHLSPNKLPEFLHPTELFWLYNSGVQETNTGGIELSSSPDANGNSVGGAMASSSGIGSFHSKSSCLFLLDGCISKNKLKELIKNRLVETTVTNKFERFTQRVMSLRSLGFVWIRCATFDLDEHIIEIDNSMDFVSNEELQSYLSNLISRHKFDMSKPLWSVYYKQTVNRKSERSTMVLFVSHQSFSDGVSLMRMFLRGLVDNRNQLDVKPRFAFSVLRRSQIKQLIFGWSSLFYKLFFRHHPAKNESAYLRRRSTSNTSNTAAPAAATTSANSPAQNVLVWSDSFDLMHLNRLKLITRSRMNDFLVSVVGGILRHYLQHKGINNPHNIRCLMPVDLRSNKYPMKMEARKSALCSFELPVKIEGCVPRLWATKLATHSLKSSSDFLLIHFLIRVLFRIFPNRFAYRCMRAILSENMCVVSTLGCGDSSLATVSVANQCVKNIIYFYPTVANVAISFSIITYGDEVRLAMLADSGVISNPEFITKQFIKQLRILSDLLSNRRIPGEVKKGTRPPVDFDQLYSHPLMDVNQMDDYAVNDMQVKMTQIQQELQQLTESMEKLDTSSSDYNKKKQVILIKSEKLRKEFSRILTDMQSRSNHISQALPSDDEDELEPDERIRLRSASVASRVSSHSRRLLRDSHSEHSNVDKQITSSRKASLAQNSRHGSLSYSSGNSHSREFSHHATSNQNLHALNVNNANNASNHHPSISIENEINRTTRRSTDHS